MPIRFSVTFAGVNIVTLAEGDIARLHIEFKETMRAILLKDLGEKVHRGLRPPDAAPPASSSSTFFTLVRAEYLERRRAEAQ